MLKVFEICPYVLTTRKITPFIDCRPGRHWYEGFRKRHQSISTRVAQDLTTARANVYKEDLIEWFGIVGEYLAVSKLLNLPAKSYINCDETYVPLCPKAARVLAEQGMPNVHRIVDQNEREGLTVLFTYCADGTRAPPMVLYPAKETILEEIVANFSGDWGIGCTENGWMTVVSFYEYVTNVLYPWLVKTSVPFPVTLFLDGHSSHCTKPLVEFCKDHQITLISLPPHATHIMQPLDKSYFGCFKEFWANQLPQWKVENQVTRFTKTNFPLALRSILDKFPDKEMIQNGFKSCGLYPWDQNAVDYNVLDKRKKKKGEQGNSSASEQNKSIDAPAAQVVKLFEDTLDESLLQQFKSAEAEGKWTGDNTQLGLFEHWLKIKNHSLERNPEECLRVNGSVVSSSSTPSLSNSSCDLAQQLQPVNESRELVSGVLQQTTTESVPSETSHQENLDWDCSEKSDPVVIMNTSNDGLVTFEMLNDEAEAADAECHVDQLTSMQILATEKDLEIDSCNEIITHENRPITPNLPRGTDISLPQKRVETDVKKRALLTPVNDKMACPADLELGESSSKDNSELTDSIQIIKKAPSSDLADVEHDSTLTSNENFAEATSPVKFKQPRKQPSPKKLQSSVREKENSGSVPPVTDGKEFQDLFEKSFTFPEEYLPKREKLKLEKGKKNKRHPVATSDAWNEEYEKKEALKKEAEQRMTEKKALQALKRKLLDDKKALEEKIRALTPKRIKKEKQDS